MSKPDGGPAFPEVFTDEKWSETHANFKRDVHSAGGMSLLDYFAAASMPVVAIALKDTPKPEGVTLGQHAASIAYAIAARMLAERTK